MIYTTKLVLDVQRIRVRLGVFVALVCAAAEEADKFLLNDRVCVIVGAHGVVTGGCASVPVVALKLRRAPLGEPLAAVSVVHDA